MACSLFDGSANYCNTKQAIKKIVSLPTSIRRWAYETNLCLSLSMNTMFSIVSNWQQII